MENKLFSSRVNKNLVWRLFIFLFFVINLFFIGLKIRFPNNLHPDAFWFNTSADLLHKGDNFWIRFRLNEPKIESRSTGFSDQYQYQFDKSIQYGFIEGKDNLEPPKSVCIDRIIVSEYIEFGKDILNGLAPVCNIIGENEHDVFTTVLDLAAITNEKIYYDVDLNFNSFYYPFIKSTNLIILQIEYHTVDKDDQVSGSKTLIPGVEIYLDNQSKWDIEINELNYVLPAELPKTSPFVNGEIAIIETTISGPLYFQILSIFLVSGMIALIALMLTIESTSSFIQALAATLFGLYGVRQVLTPQDIQAKTILDVVFVFLYAFAIYTIVDHILLKFIYLKKEKGVGFPFATSFSSNIYHDAACIYLRKIPENSKIYFKNEREAKERDLKRCKRCLS